jgi:hypothetical protein
VHASAAAVPTARRMPAAAAVSLLAALAVLGGLAAAGDSAVEVATRAPAARPPTPATPEMPAERLALVSPLAPPDGREVVRLGAPLAAVADRLGPWTATEPDAGGVAHVWQLSAAASLAVRAGGGGSGEVDGFVARVAPGEDGRLAIGGVVLGHTTLREAVAAWGPGFVAAVHEGADYAVAYEGCAHGWPVVLKLDVAGRGGRPLPDPSASPLSDSPVVSALVAYADEPATACRP